MLQPNSVTQSREAQSYAYNAASFNEPVYRKTRAGHQEVDDRQLLRRAELRRLLILIDGRRTPDELARCVRSSELHGVIENLLTLGLIEPVVEPSFATIGAYEALNTRESLSPQQIDAARVAAAFAASELIGHAASPYCAKLLACEDSGTLRSQVSIVQTKIRATAGEDAATMFVESIRDAAASAA